MSRCLQAGCTCKDARIVSTRVASFWRDLAAKRGETADRVIRRDPLPAVTAEDRPATRTGYSAWTEDIGL